MINIFGKIKSLINTIRYGKGVQYRTAKQMQRLSKTDVWRYGKNMKIDLDIRDSKSEMIRHYSDRVKEMKR